MTNNDSDNGYTYHQAYNSDVEAAETDWIAARRSACGAKSDHVGATAGLALSGGGIRSASFCLGVLQALHRYKRLKYFDFMSSVSGGGYAASALTWYMAKIGRFPFGVERKDFRSMGGRVLGWIRGHAKYLTPGGGLTVRSLVAAVIAAIFTNLLIITPILMLFVALPEYIKLRGSVALYEFVRDTFYAPFGNVENWMDAAFMRGDDLLTLYGLLFIAGFILFITFFALVIVQAWYSAAHHGRSFLRQRRLGRLMGNVLWFFMLLGAFSWLPIVHHLVQDLDVAKANHWLQVLGFSGTGLAGILTALLGTKVGKQNDDTRGPRAFLFQIGLLVMIVGILLLLYHIVSPTAVGGIGLDPRGSLVFWSWLGFALLLALTADINIVSMHRFYRNRLLEAFMPRTDIPKQDGKPPNPDTFRLASIQPHCGPYHIINTTLSTVGSGNPVLQQRGGENFIFSPLYSGSYNTAYRPTRSYVNGQMDLATAFAVSGAAVSPNNYFTRSRPLSFIMSLFNIRLSYWIRNPKMEFDIKLPGMRPMWYWYMFRELLGFGLSEKTWQVLLSDGGHFENLGVYELIRRRCKFILAVDAGMDVNWEFQDLARAVELARVDFGAHINFDDCDFSGKGFENPQRPYYLGCIHYVDGEKGFILLVKTGMIPRLSADIAGYHKAHPDFPDESTANQFFNEQQFEAYRELGYTLGRLVARPADHDDDERSRVEEEFWKPLRKAITLPDDA